MKQIALTQGKCALVDNADFDFLNQWKWCALKNRNKFYAVRGSVDGNGKRILIPMHRQILGLSDPKALGDHKDGNGLNNQRENLRSCTNAENLRNRPYTVNSKTLHKGVYWDKSHNCFKVQICTSGHQKHIGHFKSIEDAAKAYDEAAKRLHGEFAHLNFPKP